MNNTDRKRFAEIMTGMADNFRDTVTPEGLQMRFDMLADFAIGQVEQAAKQIMLTRKYTKMPTIADFVEAIKNEPKVEDKALVIASEIVSNVKEHGAGVFPYLADDKVAMHLMTRRWPYREWAAQVLESELKWWIKEFCEAYRAFDVNKLLSIENMTAPEDVKQLAGGLFKSF